MVRKLASYVLTSDLEILTARDLTRHVSHLRGLSEYDLSKQVSPLVA